MARSLNPEKRDQFLHAALELFVSQGVINTSTAEIARAAGTAAGTLFLYFPTKQALLDALAIDIAREQSARITGLLEPAFDARQSFYTIWAGTLHWFLENLPAYLYLQQVRDAGWISAEAVAETEKFFGYYFDAIQKGVTEARLKPYPPGLIGDFLYHDLVAVMNHLRRQPDPAGRAVLIEQGFEIYWSGISRPDKEQKDEL